MMRGFVLVLCVSCGCGSDAASSEGSSETWGTHAGADETGESTGVAPTCDEQGHVLDLVNRTGGGLFAIGDRHVGSVDTRWIARYDADGTEQWRLEVEPNECDETPACPRSGQAVLEAEDGAVVVMFSDPFDGLRTISAAGLELLSVGWSSSVIDATWAGPDLITLVGSLGPFFSVFRSNIGGEVAWASSLDGSLFEPPLVSLGYGSATAHPQGGIVVTAQGHVEHQRGAVARLSDDGQVLWGRSFGGDGVEQPNGVAFVIDDAGAIVIVSQAYGATWEEPVLEVRRYSADGELEWERSTPTMERTIAPLAAFRDGGAGALLVFGSALGSVVPVETWIEALEIDAEGSISSSTRIDVATYGLTTIVEANEGWWVGGSMVSDRGADVPVLVRVREDFTVAWTRSYDGCE